MKPFNREKLQREYVECTLATLDEEDLMAVAFDFLNKDTDRLTDKELISDVSAYFPALLQEPLDVKDTD